MARFLTATACIGCLAVIGCSDGTSEPGDDAEYDQTADALTASEAFNWWVTEYNDMSSSTEDDGKCQAAYTNCGPGSNAMMRNAVTGNSPKHGAGWMRQKMFDLNLDDDCSTGTTSSERYHLLTEKQPDGDWIDGTPYYKVVNRCKSSIEYTAWDLAADMESGAVAVAETSGRYTGDGGQMAPCGWHKSSGHSLAIVAWNGTHFTVVDPDSHKKEDGSFQRCGSSKQWTTDEDGNLIPSYYKKQWTPAQLRKWSKGFGGAGGLCVTTMAGPSCVAESNTSFCNRLGKNCGTVTANDNCGHSRSVNCGGCTSPYSCSSTTNVCTCVNESDAEFCERLSGCGTVSGTDLCGKTRSVDCGACTIPAKGSLFSDAFLPNAACADVAGGSTADGATILSWTCHGADNQLWTLTKYRQLKVASSSKCARIQGSIASGALVSQYACSSTANNQKWKFPSMQVVNGESLYCMQHTATEGGTLTIQQCSETNANQRFIYRADTRELKSHNGWCVEAQNDAATNAPVKLATCSANNDNLSQKWLPDRGGFVSKVNTEQCLRVSGGNVDVPGSSIETYPCNDADKQRWALRGAIEDYTSNYCLQSSTSWGGQLTIATCNGSAQQTWTLWSPE